MADGCVENEFLTPWEEDELVDRLVMSIKEEPDNWTFRYDCFENATARIRLNTRDGRKGLRISSPEKIQLGLVSRWRLWKLIHKRRHQQELDGSNVLFKNLTENLPELPKEEEEPVKPKALIWQPMIWLIAFFKERREGKILQITDQSATTEEREE